jgi:hypothetical protein
MDNAAAAENTFRALWGRLQPLRFKDRRVTFLADVDVKSSKDAGMLARHSRLLTKALNEILDDPNSLASITPKHVSWDRTGDLVKSVRNDKDGS